MANAIHGNKAHINLLKKQLEAKRKVHKEVAYFLLNHVVRDDDVEVVEAAKKLASMLNASANKYKLKLEQLNLD